MQSYNVDSHSSRFAFHTQQNVLERAIPLVVCINSSFTFIAISHGMDEPICLAIHLLREVLVVLNF